MATIVGGFESDSDRRQTKKRDAYEARTPGRHANTDALAGNSVPQPNIPGKRAGTEHLAPPSDPGVPGKYTSGSVFGGPGDQHTAPTTTSAAPAATSQPAPAAHGPVTAADFRVDTWARSANGTTRRAEDHLNEQGHLVYRFYSSGIHAHATVTALTPAAQAYNVGFLQTMHNSTRRAMFVDSEGQVVGTFEAVQNNPVMDTRTDLRSPPPWYNWSLPLGTTTKSPSMTDNPRFEVPQWSPDLVGQPRETDGSESFTTYLVAMQGTTNPIYLGNLSWSMNWRGRFSGGAFHGQAASLGATNRNTTGNAVLGTSAGGAANNQGTARYTPAPAAPVAASSTGRDTNHHLGTHAGAYGGGMLGAVRDATASARAAADKKEAEDAKPTPDKIEKYLLHNQVDVWRTVGDHLNNIFLPTPNERLAWDRPDVFHAAILDELVKGVGNFKPLSKLDEVFVPSNAMKVVGPTLPTTADYSIEVGMVIAHELHLAIVESIKRLGKRYLEILDSQGADSGKTVTFEQLVLSKPIDRYVGKVLCSPGIVKATALEGKAAEAAKGKDVGRKPIAKITLEGEHDPKLWNWIRVEPIDATAEDVAAELFKRGNTHDKHGDANAYMLAAAPPLFGLPKKQALEMPQFKQIAQQFMFRGGMSLVFDVEDSVDKQLLQIANSSAIDAVAHEPNGGRVDENIQRAPAELNKVQDQLRDVALQLTFIADKLQPWGLADKLVGANAYIKRQQGDVSHADQKKLGDISAVVDGQKGRLTRIGGAITKLAASAADLGGANPKSDDAAPLREILDLLAVAAGTSHIAAASEPKLVEAMQLQVTLSVRALQATERGMISATKTVHQQAGDNVTTGNRSHEAVGLQEESRKLQSQILDGQDVDPEEMEDVSIRSQAVTLKSRTYGTIHALDDIRQAATVVDKGDAAIIASMFSGEFRDLPSACKKLIAELHPILGNLNAEFNDADAELKRGGGSEARKKQVREARRKAVADAQDKFKDLQQRHDLAKFFKNANEKIKNQQLRAAIVRAAALIGLSLVAGAVAEFAAGGLASMLMDAGGASNVAELGLAARSTVSITRSAVDSAVNAMGMVDKDHGFVEAWEQNMIMTLASNAVFGSMTSYAEAAAKGERVEEQFLQTWAQKQVAKAGKLGKSLGKAGEVIKGAATISAHTIWGAAIAEVAGRIVTGKSQPSAQTMQDWAIQGASVFLGRQIGHRIGANKKLYKEIDETIGKTNHMLAMKAEKLQALADSVAGSKDATKALELLNEHEKFMRDELESLEKAIEKGDPNGDLELHRAATEAALKEMSSAATISAKFKLIGLDELIPGALWRGTHSQIKDAVDQAKKDHKDAKVKEPDAHTKRWTLESEVGKIEIEEIVESHGAKPAEEPRDKAPLRNESEKPPHERITQKDMKAVDPNVDLVTGATGVTFQGRGDRIGALAARLPPEPGYFDVVVHGDGHSFAVLHDGQWVKIKPNSVRKFIRAQGGYNGQPIRLLSCEAGAHGASTAQAIADGMKVHVKAPTEKIWLAQDKVTGEVELIIGNDPKNPSGGWVDFDPQGGPKPKDESKLPPYERTTERIAAQPDPTLEEEHGTKPGDSASHDQVSLGKELPEMTPAERIKVNAAVDKQVERIRSERVQGATPAAEKAVKDAAYEAAEKTYRERRRDGQEDAGARKAASDAGKRAAEQEWTVQAKRLAVDKANQSIDDGSVFDRSAMPEDAKKQLDAYRKGTAKEGASARKYSTAFTSGMTLADMEHVLAPEVTAGTAARVPEPIKGPPPSGQQTQIAYYFNDGSVIRLKPKGDEFNRWRPSYSVEVKNDHAPAGPSDPSMIAFKIDDLGRAVPKAPEHIANPYTDGKFEQQRDVYHQHVLDAGHRLAK